MVKEFCRECPKCCRVFEYDAYEQFQEENRGRSSTALPTNNDHLKSVLRKWNIKEMFSSSSISEDVPQDSELPLFSVQLF